ncbi:alpha-glucosidase [Nostocaceae cyanobacterium CENA357]|uniref:Alpha-glucosidase n=1 Tax=Atlanticothrix silvestris CENA357 TaxID=1725252 RepID=A0A8J7HB74_9CYAN|nr:alpha-glucosidase [Atlanticothrix silvestris]MBH8553178.1 alpha-glucosidase [Atlanticothrix silvestris CENA357]
MKAPWQSPYPVMYPPYTVACSGWVLKRFLRLLAEPLKKLSRWKMIPLGKISTSVPSQSFKLGEFTIDWQGSNTTQPSLRISHQSNEALAILQTSPGYSFVSGGNVRLNITEERGSIEIDEHKYADFTHQFVDGIKQEDNTLVIYGRLLGRQSTNDEPQYILTLQTVGSRELDFQLQISNGNVNQIQLQFVTSPDEHFYGFGEQFSDIDCKGQWMPIVCEEGGIGRGDRAPKTLNLLGVAGNRFSSYAPMPYFFTNKGRSIFLTNTEPAIFNLRDPQITTIRVVSSCMQGRILCGESPLDIIELYTNYVGRMPPLPDWLNSGAIIGMQGGTEFVRQVWSQLRDFDTPIAGFWLQDWVGQRRTIAGKQLWWNWQLDESTYPGWQQLVTDLAKAEIAVGVYVNPFLVERPQQPNQEQRHLYREAIEKDFVVKNQAAEPYLIKSTDFSAALLDVTNPDARKWFKSILKDEVLGKGAKFWMADFAEAAPFDGVYATDESGLIYHNEYPVDWVRVNQEAIQEAGQEGDAWFFNRAGFLKTPSHSISMWLGDQNTSWGKNDGITSALKGMISGGLSGFSINHSDIGGYTSIANPILEAIGVGFKRSRELLYRWMEMNAFTPIFRTHEGNQPDKNVQFYTDKDTLTTFSYWSKVYAALAPYRRELMAEAAIQGYPLVRHLVLHYPDDPNVYKIEDQFLLGRDFLIAPVLKPRKKSVNVYFPAGEWVHLWSGNIYGSLTIGVRQKVPAPLGQPAVFYREGSKAPESLLQNLKAKNMLTGAPQVLNI